MPQFQCIHCGQQIETEAEFSGLAANCPVCQGTVLVPLLNSDAPPRGAARVLSTFEEPPDPVAASLPEPPAPPPPPLPLPASEPMRAPSGVPLHHVSYREDEMDVPQWVPGSGFTRWAAQPLPAWSDEKSAPSRKPWIFMVLALGLGLALLVGGFIWWQNHQRQKLSVLVADATPPSVAQAPASIPDTQLTVEQLSERQLAKALESMKLSPEDAAWYASTWRQSFRKMFNILQDETDHINDDGLDQLFDPERLLHDKLFLESFRMLKVLNDRSNVLIKHLSTVGGDFSDAVVARIPQDKLPKVSRPEPGAALAPLLSQISAAVSQQRRMIDYLKHTFGRWKVNDGKFEFESERDRQDYDRLLDELGKISAEMDRLQGASAGGGK